MKNINDDDFTVQFIDIDSLKKIYNKFMNKDIDMSHIVYDEILDKDNINRIDPDGKREICDFRRIDGYIHDGTLTFTHNIIINTFLPLVEKSVCHVDFTGKPFKGYRVGKLRLETKDVKEKNEYGITLTCSQKSSIPVKMIYCEENKNAT